jgi:hypothetical protein
MSGSTFTWTTSGNLGDWNTPTSWTPSGPPTISDTAVFGNEPGSIKYVANVSAGETASANELLFDFTLPHIVTLSVSGILTTNTVMFASNQSGSVVVAAGGVMDVVNAIDIIPSDRRPDIFSIAGDGAGGRMELGSLSVGAQPSAGFIPMYFQFQNVSTSSGPSTGVIEFQSGFVPGVTTTQVIDSVGWGNSFVFDTADFTGDTVSYDATKNIVTVKSGNTTVLTMDNVFANAGTTFEIVNTDTIQAICYARGTMIRTPDGEQPVEKLRPGRRVMTLVDGREVPQTVTWLGHRRLGLAGHPKPETAAPIRILRGAFADNMPHRDLVVSPDHAIFVDGKLICARQLVNGTTIRQEFDWTAVDYYHVELDSHAILLAEGLPAESYIDTGNSGFFANADAPLVLHPDLTDESDYPTREAGSCVPFVWDEASVRPVWQRLAERAAFIGQPVPQRATTTDAGLLLLFKGRSVKPVYGDDRLVIFTVPRGARDVRLVSRAQSPTAARPWLEDRRRLGVRVARIVLRSAEEVREVSVDHPDLAKGWWAIERDGQAICRWTDGEAELPLPAMRGDVMLEVHLAGMMTYVMETSLAA